MTSFNWLHLTDVHCGLAGQSPLWPNVRQPFFDDLARLHDNCGPFHAVFFTGDLVQSGEQAEFTRLEEAVLIPLWETLRQLGSPDTPLFAVPGNHDLLRAPGKPTAVLRQLLRSDGFHEIAQEFWSEPTCEYRQAIELAFANYVHWWQNTRFRRGVSVHDGILPGDFSATLKLPSSLAGESPARIGIVGLNTTFLQIAAGNFAERLACDVRQIHAVCDEDVPTWIRERDTSILLTHQGPEWLDKRSAAQAYPEINPAGRFAVHLFGHMHKEVVRTTRFGGGVPVRHWQGSSLFGMKQYGEPPTYDRRHGYGAGRIDLTKGSESIRHWPRRGLMDANGWRFERDTDSCILDESDGGTTPEGLTVHTSRGTSAVATPIRALAGKGTLSRTSPPRVATGPTRWPWPHTDPFLTAYCDAVSKEHSHIRFVEIPYLKDVSDVALDRLFVDPRFSPQEIHPDTPSSRWPPCLPALDVITDHPTVVLLGDPGSGKSTLISCLSWQLCRSSPAQDSHWTSTLGGYIPLPMVLRELRLRADITWEGLLDCFLEHRVGKLLQTRAALETLLSEGRAIVLLDGLDEVGNLTIRRKLRDAVHIGMSAYPNCRWILTSRIVGYNQVPFHSRLETLSNSPTSRSRLVGHAKHTTQLVTQVADLFYFTPFDDEQISTFSLNWYRQHETQPDLVEGNSLEFVRAIRENDGTQRLARIPFLLTLMALIHHKNARLPHGRTELYERIAAAYLESIDLRRQLDQLPYSLAQKKRWLAEVAYQMQLRRVQQGQGDILAGKHEIRRWLRTAMAESGTRDTKGESEALLNYFAERSGLLLPRGDNKFAFMHLSLQEYFAACYLEPRLTASRFSKSERKVQPSDRQLRTWANSEVWSESFLLLFELLSEKSMAETEGLLNHLFEPRLGRDESRSSATAVGLLSELATDPFVLLTAETRRRIRQKCWKWVFGFGYRSSRREPHSSAIKVVARLLREYQGQIDVAWKAASIVRSDLRKVKYLDLSSPSLTDLRPLAGLTALEFLSLAHCTALEDISPIAQLKQLTALSLEGSPNISSLEALGSLDNLRTLILGGPVDLTSIARIRSLEGLHLHYEPLSSVDVSPLAGMTRLSNICAMRVPFRYEQRIVEGSRRTSTGYVNSDLLDHPERILSPGVRVLIGLDDKARIRSRMGSGPSDREGVASTKKPRRPK